MPDFQRRVTGKYFAGWCAPCCKLPDLAPESPDSVDSHAVMQAAMITARKFLKIFVAYLLCSATFPRP
jgi:hypothetical protein